MAGPEEPSARFEVRESEGPKLGLGRRAVKMKPISHHQIGLEKIAGFLRGQAGASTSQHWPALARRNARDDILIYWRHKQQPFGPPGRRPGAQLRPRSPRPKWSRTKLNFDQAQQQRLPLVPSPRAWGRPRASRPINIVSPRRCARPAARSRALARPRAPSAEGRLPRRKSAPKWTLQQLA